MRRVLFIALVAGLLPGGLDAQATPPRQFTVTANAGFVDASGNSEITTLSGDERVEYRPRNTGLTFTQTLGAVYGRTDGATSANRIKGGLRVAHAVENRLSAFVSAEYEKNRFAGIRRRFEEVVSLAMEVVKAPRTSLSIEMGVAFNQQRDLQDVDNSFVAARSGAEFKQNFTESAYFQQKVEVLPNLQLGEDLRVNSETSLVAPLSKRFAVKLSYAIRFDNLPEPGFKRTDRVFTSGLQVTL